MMGCLGANLTALHTQALSPRMFTAPETRPKKTVKIPPSIQCFWTLGVCSLSKTQASKTPRRSIKVGSAEPIARPISAHAFLRLSQWCSQKVWHPLKLKGHGSCRTASVYRGTPPCPDREGNGTPTPVLLPGKSHGRRSLAGCSPWGREESDMTERLHFHFSLSCIGEGNGNPLQCSCLENPGDGGAWWAAVCGVAQSWTRLKQLSSSLAALSRKTKGL